MTGQVVTHGEWIEKRIALLKKEKEFTRLRDELSAERRKMPWEAVTKEYWFEGPKGKESLGDLFAGRGQIFMYHFMLGPGWAEGCKSCSYLADHFDGMTVHLANRDTTLVVVSRAPYPEIGAYQKRMGWKFKWVSSYGSDFNLDYHVSFPKEQTEKEMEYNYEMTRPSIEELPGASVFTKTDQGIFHTYSTYARGLDPLVGTYQVLDLMPKGRDEEGLANTMAWVRHHDKYAEKYEGSATSCCH